MDTIGTQKIWSFLDDPVKATPASNGQVRHAEATTVANFRDLAHKVAELQFLNRDFFLLFRGQNGDWKNKKGNTTLKPRIFRARDSTMRPKEKTLQNRYEQLYQSEEKLTNHHYFAKGNSGLRLRRQQVLRWALLQHYEVCDTPLLDVTNSLRIAASFATLNAQQFAYVFVLGVPNISGAVTASAETGLQVIRLASVCPPAAVRPHLQEGYLLGEYPEMAGLKQNQHYKSYEIDLGRRLIAKFRFEPNSFWQASRYFPRIDRAALYPDNDPLLRIARTIKLEIENSKNDESKP